MGGNRLLLQGEALTCCSVTGISRSYVSRSKSRIIAPSAVDFHRKDWTSHNGRDRRYLSWPNSAPHEKAVFASISSRHPHPRPGGNSIVKEKRGDDSFGPAMGTISPAEQGKGTVHPSCSSPEHERYGERVSRAGPPTASGWASSLSSPLSITCWFWRVTLII